MRGVHDGLLRRRSPLPALRRHHLHGGRHAENRHQRTHVRRGRPRGGRCPISWYQLLDIIAQRRIEFDYYAERPPEACPNDGEPLRNAPPTDSGSGVILYCPFDGWQYPRDWRQPEIL